MSSTMLRAVLIGCALSSCTGSAKRVEVVKATTPHDDTKPNSPSVPDVYALAARFERVVVLRLKFDTDLLAGLESAVQKEGIRNAVFLSAVGSVRGYHLHTVSNRTFPSRNIYIEDPVAPADIVAMSGYVIDGRIHAHIMLADAERGFGGHLERGTSVFTFAVVTLGVLDDQVDLRRVDDKTHR
jgi:uncharacterized protein